MTTARTKTTKTGKNLDAESPRKTGVGKFRGTIHKAMKMVIKIENEPTFKPQKSHKLKK